MSHFVVNLGVTNILQQLSEGHWKLPVSLTEVEVLRSCYLTANGRLTSENLH